MPFKADYSRKGPLCRGCGTRMMANAHGYECMNVLCNKKHVATFLRKGSRATRQKPLSGLKDSARSVAKYALYGAEIEDPLLAAGVRYGVPVAMKYGPPLAKAAGTVIARGASASYQYAKQKLRRKPDGVEMSKQKTLGAISSLTLREIVFAAKAVDNRACKTAFNSLANAIFNYGLSVGRDPSVDESFLQASSTLSAAKNKFRKTCLRSGR